MSRAIGWVVAVAGEAALAAHPVLAQTSPPERFLAALQQAVDAEDRRAVASMVAYPATVLAGGFNIPVKDTKTFLTLYKAVVTPELRCAVVLSAIAKPGQVAPAHPVAVSPDGLVIADGRIWAPLKDGRFRIARITVPPAAPSATGRTGVERVTFLEPKGERTASFSGWLVRRNVDAFVVTVKKGEMLQARIEGFRGRDATLRVSDPPAGSNPVTDAGRTWTGVATSGGDYRIAVVHLAPYCDPAERYKLFITLR